MCGSPANAVKRKFHTDTRTRALFRPVVSSSLGFQDDYDCGERVDIFEVMCLLSQIGITETQRRLVSARVSLVVSFYYANDAGGDALEDRKPRHVSFLLFFSYIFIETTQARAI